MCPFYTRKGDEGDTGLLGRGRFPKEDLRFEELGDLDEANAAFGMARCWVKVESTPAVILRIQRDLYSLMAETAAGTENSEKFHVIGSEQISWLEEQIAEIEKTVRVPEEFILPGDSAGGAVLDLARTIIRRAERHMVALLHRGDVRNQDLLRYLNRLSSLCFVLELAENQITGQDRSTLAKDD